MDANLSRGYIQLGKGQPGRFGSGLSHLSPPADKYDRIYYSLLLAGLGFLLPYNSFIIAVDYFQTQYPGTTIVFDMSLVYIVMAFFAVLANNFLVEALSLNTRITFGYIVSFFTLLFVAVCEVWWGMFTSATSYTVNLIAVAVVALGCTVQQSSFYGYTSMLPSRYTQAVMAGESGAGLLVSINRILTKMLLNDQRVNTLIFFTISVVIVGLCFILHQVVRQTDFVQFYLTLCRESQKITLEPTEDAGLMEPGDSVVEGSKSSQYGVLKLEVAGSPLEAGAGGHFSFANPVYEPSAVGPPSVGSGGGVTGGGPTYKVEDVVVRIAGEAGSSFRKPVSSPKPWSAIKKGLRARGEVAQNIWQYMLTICIVYLVTLSLYPGIESEIVSCKFGSWMPVILMAAFNASDLIGKMLASLVYDWTRSRLMILSAVRLVMIPALLMCATPRERPMTMGEGFPLFISILLGLTNGVLGSVPMIQAPSRVSEQHRELTGNIMTLSYNFGLTAGSLLAYVFEAILGPPLRDPCGISHLSSTNGSSSSFLMNSTSTLATLLSTTSSSVSPPTSVSPFLPLSTLLLSSTPGAIPASVILNLTSSAAASPLPPLNISTSM